MTNGGETRSKKTRMHHDLREWFNPESISNVLSFSEVAKNHRVYMDTAEDEDVLVEVKKDNGCGSHRTTWVCMHMIKRVVLVIVAQKIAMSV